MSPDGFRTDLFDCRQVFAKCMLKSFPYLFQNEGTFFIFIIYKILNACPGAGLALCCIHFLKAFKDTVYGRGS